MRLERALVGHALAENWKPGESLRRSHWGRTINENETVTVIALPTQEHAQTEEIEEGKEAQNKLIEAPTGVGMIMTRRASQIRDRLVDVLEVEYGLDGTLEFSDDGISLVDPTDDGISLIDPPNSGLVLEDSNTGSLSGESDDILDGQEQS